MSQHAFFSIDKTPYAERFGNLQQALKIDVFQNGSARLWLTTGEEITVTGPQAAPIIDLLDPSIAGLSAVKRRIFQAFGMRERDLLCAVDGRLKMFRAQTCVAFTL